MTETVFRSPHTSQAHQEIANNGLILLVQVGSLLHGTATGDDDRDEMGICIPPPEYVIGLKQFEQYEYRTKPMGVRSGRGDLDKTVYSLKKYARLAAGGNPSVLLPLFANGPAVQYTSWPGHDLRARADLFISKTAGARFLGYLTRQRDRMVGTLAQRTNRPELVEKYGFDTKFGGHAVRLGIQGVELMKTGRITLPMPEKDRGRVLSVRLGNFSKNAVLSMIEDKRAELRELSVSSELPPVADYEAIDRWLVDVHQKWWRQKRWI